MYNKKSETKPNVGLISIVTFQYFATYHVWATKRLCESLKEVSDVDFNANCGLFFQSIFGTLNHLLLAERDLWLRRFKHEAMPVIALNSIVELDRLTLINELIQTTYDCQKFIGELNKDHIEQQLTYTTSTGEKISLPYIQTLFHVFNHATHHRGQITVAMTQLGYSCPSLDMVYMLVEQNPNNSHG